MHIDNLTINLPPVSAESLATMESLMRSLQRLGDAGTTSQAAAALEVQGTANATPPKPGQHWPDQGGIYICTLPAQFGLPARHLVVGTNEAENLKWGGYSTDTPAAASQTDGRANTAALLADSEAHPAAAWAAQYAEDGHTDYHLPSRYELFMCWLCAPQLLNNGDWYWSSSQSSSHGAWAQDFEYGYSSGGAKDNEFRARPVRWIHL